MPEEDFDALLATLKKAARALGDAGVPFALGGGLAAWARGGPETDHDLDLMIKAEDAERALEVLTAAGFRPEKPPEDWLYKAWDDGVLVDLIFHPSGFAITDEVLARSEEMEVVAVPMRVMALEDLLAAKLFALTDHHLDYEGLLQIARPLREQIDWDEVRARTEASPYARAFFTLVERLGIVEPERSGG